MANKYSATISTGGFNRQQFLILVSLAFAKLGWKYKGMDEKSIKATTGMSAASWGEEITVTVKEQDAEIFSTCGGKQLFDWGKNRRNVARLSEVLDELCHHYTPEQLDEYYQQAQAEEENELAAVDERPEQGKLTATDSPELKQGGYYVTYALIAINVLVFIAMLIGGVSFMNPSAADLLLWGGNNHVYTASGDWWRLITNIFLHGGIVHLLFNMYALFIVGMYLEPIMGRAKFLVAYLSCGVLASLTSIWWNDNIVSVGASGAIFGMYGLFLALLTTNYIDKNIRKAMLQSILIFVGYNLVYGLKDGIDNAAHIGGLLSGFILGYIFYFVHVKQPRPQLFIPAALLLTLLITVPALSSRRDDTVRFGRMWDEFADLEEKGLAPLRNSDKLDSVAFIQQVETVSMPAFMDMKKLMDQSQKYHLPADLKTERTLMNKYVDQRIEHTRLWLKIIKESDGNLWPRWDSLANEIDSTIKQLQSNK